MREMKRTTILTRARLCEPTRCALCSFSPSPGNVAVLTQYPTASFRRYPALSRAIMCTALRLGLVGTQHAWILTGQNPTNWWKRDTRDQHDCTDEELKRATQGYLAMARDVLGVQARTGVALDRLPTGETPAEWRIRYAAASEAGVPESDFGPLAYDAGWTFGKALHAMLTTSSNAGNADKPYTVADLTTPTPSTALEMRRVLKAQSFFGASGPVVFDASTGDRTYVDESTFNEDVGRTREMGHDELQ